MPHFPICPPCPPPPHTPLRGVIPAVASVDCLGLPGCGSSAASLDAMPVDRGTAALTLGRSDSSSEPRAVGFAGSRGIRSGQGETFPRKAEQFPVQTVLRRPSNVMPGAGNRTSCRIFLYNFSAGIARSKGALRGIKGPALPSRTLNFGAGSAGGMVNSFLGSGS